MTFKSIIGTLFLLLYSVNVFGGITVDGSLTGPGGAPTVNAALLSATANFALTANTANVLLNGVIVGSGASGQVTFWDGTSSIDGDTDFLWDSASNLFGISGQAEIGLNVTADGTFSAVVGGDRNIASGNFSFVGGGVQNTAGDEFTFVGGGDRNKILNSQFSAIVGGQTNTIDVPGLKSSFIGGGFSNIVTGNQSAVVGGSENSISGLSSDSFIGGGDSNTLNSGFSAIVGGATNQNFGNFSFIGGGVANTTSDVTGSGIVGGGLNIAGGVFSFIGGGQENTTASSNAFVAGGKLNEANGENSFAGGFRAKALQKSTFVWADSTAADFSSSAQDTFIIRADGGVFIGHTTSINGDEFELSGGAFKTLGGNKWNVPSDRRLKKNIAGIENSLEKLLALRGRTFEWRKSKKFGSPGVKMGFIAQEIEKVFPQWITSKKGRLSKYKFYNPVGIEALIVEALRELRAEKDDQISILEAKNRVLTQHLNTIETRLKKLEKK